MSRTVKELNRVVRKYMKKWKYTLILHLWEIEVIIVDHLVGDELMAVCNTDWEYLNSSIKFSYELLKDKSEEEIEKTVIHELLHVVTDEIGKGSTERVVSHLTAVFTCMRKEGELK